MGVARYSGLFSAGNVHGQYSIQFTDGEVLQRTWPDARLSLHEAINKLVKEKKAKEKQKRRHAKAQFDGKPDPKQTA